MTSGKRQVKNVFCARATEWADLYSGQESQGLETENLIARRRFALNMVQAAVPPGSKVLDVGCGPGDTAAELIGRGYEVWGVDIAEPMIRYARDRCGSDRFQVADIEKMPFPDNTFNAVVCLGVIEYLDTDEESMREIWRVLKPGGSAVIATPSAIFPLYHLDRTLLELEAVVRPLYYLAKYRLRGKRVPSRQPVLEISSRRYHLGRWSQALRTAGFESEECIRHGWGWYRSHLGFLVLFVSRTGKRLRHSLELVIGPLLFQRISEKFVQSRALNWLGSEQIMRVRAVK